MCTSFARVATAAGIAGMLLAPGTLARAQEVPSSINQPPAGPGTEQPSARAPAGLRPGIEASAGLGSGFSDTYIGGIEGRVGYTLRQGVYAGGAVQHFVGHSVHDQSAHATFVGGEIGYKAYPTPAIEVRPFVFVGPSFITQVTSDGTAISKVDLAVQPGVIGMYHFGSAFVGADVHYMLYPAPNTIAAMASAGFGFW
jgi:hypothetical protein